MVLQAAAVDRILGSWGITATDPQDVFQQSGPNIGNRGEWLYDNDGLGKAIVESLIGGTLGPQGLIYRSIYQADDNDEASAAEIAVRRKIQRRIDCGTAGTRFDAAGFLTRREMSAVTLASKITLGDSWSVRCWLPNRPGRHTHATCWRVIHPSRVCNPNFGPDTPRIRQGIEIDENGTPIAIYVLRNHPASVVLPQRVWDRVPIWSPDGQQNVTHDCLHRHAGQLRPTGWFGPVIQLMRLFGRTLEAKTVADTLKASMGLIVECDNPTAMAAADSNGAVLNGNTKILPGKIYYVRTGTVWKTLDFDYKGEDFASWFDVMMTNICAPFQVPMEFVLQRLTKSNMASSRVAMGQAYMTFQTAQNDLIASTEDPWNHSLILEDLARGNLGIDLPDEIEALDRILMGHYSRPAQLQPNPLQEANAQKIWRDDFKKSLTSIYAAAGSEFIDEAKQSASDQKTLEDNGLNTPAPAAPGAVPPPAAPEPDPADPTDEPTDPATADENADPQPAGVAA